MYMLWIFLFLGLDYQFGTAFGIHGAVVQIHDHMIAGQYIAVLNHPDVADQVRFAIFTVDPGLDGMIGHRSHLSGFAHNVNVAVGCSPVLFEEGFRHLGSQYGVLVCQTGAACDVGILALR